MLQRQPLMSHRLQPDPNQTLTCTHTHVHARACSQPQSRGRALAWHTPIAIIISPGIRLVEEDPTFITYSEAYEVNSLRYGREADLPINMFKKRCVHMCTRGGIRGGAAACSGRSACEQEEGLLPSMARTQQHAQAPTRAHGRAQGHGACAWKGSRHDARAWKDSVPRHPTKHAHTRTRTHTHV